MLPRLQRQKGVIVSVQFSEEEAFLATQEGLEVRCKIPFSSQPVPMNGISCNTFTQTSKSWSNNTQRVTRPLLTSLSDDTVNPRLKAALKSSLLPERTICVIRDAEDKCVDDLWQRLSSVFREAGYSHLPDRLPLTGLILEEQDLHRVGVWIMPNNEDAGMIEDFYLRAISAEDWENGLAKTFVSSIPNPRFGPKISKSVYRVWLAIQSDPVGPAQALAFQQISRDAGDLPVFIQWLSDLLQVPAIPPASQ